MANNQFPSNFQYFFQKYKESSLSGICVNPKTGIGYYINELKKLKQNVHYVTKDKDYIALYKYLVQINKYLNEIRLHPGYLTMVTPEDNKFIEVYYISSNR